MIVMLNHPPETIAAFMIARFPVGTLTYKNLNSLFTFLTRIAQINTAKAEPLNKIMEALFRQGFFEMHLQSFNVDQINAFNTKVAAERSNASKFNYLPLVACKIGNIHSNEDMEIRLSR